MLAAVIAPLVTLVAFTLPASASSAESTAIVGFASSVTTVAYQQPVTFTGELAAGAAQTPVPNEPVQIELQLPGNGQYVPVATGATGSDGHFTITTTLPSGGLVRAAFSGDTGLAPSVSSPWWDINLSVTHLPSRLVLDPVPRSVPAGTPVTFSGTLEVQVNGAWQPFPDAPLTLTMEPYTSSQPNVTYATTTDSGGRFSLTEPLSETSDWIVDTTLNGYYWEAWFPDYARASYNWIDGVSKTRVAGFSLPAKAEAHRAYLKGLYATGTIERWNGNSWAGLAHGTMQLYYRPKGTARWRMDDDGQTNADGDFRVMAGVHLGTTHWQVRVHPAPDTRASTSTNAVTVTITDRTRFASAYISRSSARSWIHGQVTDLHNQLSFSSLRGLKLRLYDRRRHSTTWHVYKTATAGRNGYFHFFAAISHGYAFKVVLPAQRAFLSCTSRIL